MEQWFVLRAIFKKELVVRDALRKAGLRCYVPLCYRVETQQGRKVRRLVPAITELVFVQGEEAVIREAKGMLRETCYWLVRPVQGLPRPEKVVVRDSDMQNFMRVTEQTEADILYFRPDEVRLDKGDRIVIHGGVFDGVEGVLLKVKGRREKQLVVGIPDLAIAATEGRLALALLMAERALGSVTDATRQRCEAAVARLRPSKLREDIVAACGLNKK